LRDDTTLQALTTAKKFMFDFGNLPATIIKIPGNYAIETIRDAITPEDVALWFDAWHLDAQFTRTADDKIRVWLKTKPVSKMKLHRVDELQTTLTP